jgi:hypothetical protein
MSLRGSATTEAIPFLICIIEIAASALADAQWQLLIIILFLSSEQKRISNEN